MTTTSSGLPVPAIHPDVEPFWRASASGSLVLPRCASCGVLRFPVTAICPACRSCSTNWQEVSPHGTVRVAIVVERAAPGSPWGALTPYVTGLVDMEAGVRMPGRFLSDCNDVRHGDRVRLVGPAPDSGSTVYAFRHRCPPERHG